MIVILEHSEALYAAYVGALLGGYCPAYFAHPSEKIDISRYRESVELLLETVGGGLIVTSRAIHERLHGALTQSSVLLDDGSAIERPQVRGKPGPIARAIEGTLFLQFSSGTTGIKKGVAISPAMLMWQVDAYAEHIAAGPTDRVASWLPLYHDMGLIACLFLPLLKAIPLVAMSAFDWVKRPESLLEIITRHRSTLVWLPNFAYSFLALRAAAPREGGWDLSSLRAVVNCSEPIQHRSHRALLDKLAPRGLRENALASCYALAENTFAVTSGGIDRPLALETVEADSLAPGDRVKSAAPGAGNARTLVSSGTPLPETHVAIVDAQNRALPEGTVGEIEIASPGLFAGYVTGDEDVTGPCDGRFRTGDLGYLRGGELYVIGRLKDTIIIGGRNVQPQDVETIVEGVDGVIPGRCVAVGVEDTALGTQSLVILAETLIADAGVRRKLCAGIRERVIGGLDLVPADVALFDPMWLEKSTSGKLSRGANRQRYLAARGERTEAPPRIATPLQSRLEAILACVADTVSAGALREAPEFDAHTDLLRQGVLDSFSLVGFHLMLEDRFGADLLRAVREKPEKFRSVQAIAAELERHEKQVAAAPGTVEPQGAGDAPSESLKYHLVPQMRDVEAQPYEWVAYLMRRGAPNYRSPTLNTDEHGFRMTWRDGAAIGYAELDAMGAPKGVTLGNSFAYGIGTTHDSRTFSSRLNEQAGTPGPVWYNLAQRASVLTQERLAFELYAPAGTQSVVWVSGINNLISLIVGEGHPGNPVPFVGERQYAARMMPDARLAAPPPFEPRYEAMIRQIEIDLSAIALRLNGKGRLLFCLQPSASWIDRRWTDEELDLIDIFDAAGSPLQRAHHPRHLEPLHGRYASDLAGICGRWGIDFIDTNADPALREERWLFIDRTHMTDAGHQALAALIARHLQIE